jgi:hypothetical protein
MFKILALVFGLLSLTTAGYLFYTEGFREGWDDLLIGILWLNIYNYERNL